jgi:hypothetical protein
MTSKANGTCWEADSLKVSLSPRCSACSRFPVLLYSEKAHRSWYFCPILSKLNSTHHFTPFFKIKCNVCKDISSNAACRQTKCTHISFPHVCYMFPPYRTFDSNCPRWVIAVTNISTTTTCLYCYSSDVVCLKRGQQASERCHSVSVCKPLTGITFVPPSHCRPAFVIQLWEGKADYEQPQSAGREEFHHVFSRCYCD